MQRRPGFEEIVVRVGGQAMIALIHGDYGSLVYTNAGEKLASRNPRYTGPPVAIIEYYLNNGQRETHPAAWALPVEAVRRAIEYFRGNESPPPFIDWHPA
jgi:hypothetical protein